MWHGLFVINCGSYKLKASWKQDVQSDATFNQSLCALHLLWVNYWLCFFNNLSLVFIEALENKRYTNLQYKLIMKWGRFSFCNHPAVERERSGSSLSPVGTVMKYFFLRCRCQSISERTCTVVVVGDGTEKNPTWEGRDTMFVFRKNVRFTGEMIDR